MEETDNNHILQVINQYQVDIDNYLIEINKSTDLNEKKNLYQKILNLNNTEEKYVVDYLLCCKELAGTNEKEKSNYEKQFEKYHVCISDTEYEKNFLEFTRKNAKDKILFFIGLIRDSPLKTDTEKSALISVFTFLLIQAYNLGFTNTKKITWKNKELYLYGLYEFLIFSISDMILNNNKVKLTAKITEDEEYKKIKQDLEIAIEKERKKREENKEVNQGVNDIDSFEIQNLKLRKLTFLLLKSNYFQYIINMQEFLKDVDKNFKIKFGKFEFQTTEEKILFEDYIHFLATYEFEINDYAAFWNEAFVPLNLGDIEKIIKVDYKINFELDEDGKQLKISKGDDEDFIETKKYDLKNFIHYAMSESSVQSLMWKKNKYILPMYYKEELFVYKTKEHWKKLLINIFNSRAYTEARVSLSTQPQIDFFKIEHIIEEIIDNIKFFIYKTTFLGNINKQTQNIYEYGNYDVTINNKSVALLIFYGFHIIINIHEIGGHFNIRYQYFITLKKEFSSPIIDKNIKNLYSNYANKRDKESGETLEIKLFGKVKVGLTIKEALFILDKNNYKLKSDQFKSMFLDCNNKKLDELLNSELKTFLYDLGIDYKDLYENDDFIYNYPIDRRTDDKELSYENKNRHPINFYFDDPKIMDDFFKDYHMIYTSMKKNNA